MKMPTMEKKEKHKAVVVSKLFAGTETPFTKQVVEYPFPTNSNLHKFQATTGLTIQQSI
jgi:hypothetical protein